MHDWRRGHKGAAVSPRRLIPVSAATSPCWLANPIFYVKSIPTAGLRFICLWPRKPWPALSCVFVARACRPSPLRVS